MVHPNKRRWTLEKLSREIPYRLWFDHDAFRWEVEALLPKGVGALPPAQPGGAPGSSAGGFAPSEGSVSSNPIWDGMRAWPAP